MNVPLITWVCIAAAMILIVIIRIFISAHERIKENHNLIKSNQTRPHPNHKFFEIGNEREEFFAPGDRLAGIPDYYGDDDN